MPGSASPSRRSSAAGIEPRQDYDDASILEHARRDHRDTLETLRSSPRWLRGLPSRIGPHWRLARVRTRARFHAEGRYRRLREGSGMSPDLSLPLMPQSSSVQAAAVVTTSANSSWRLMPVMRDLGSRHYLAIRRGDVERVGRVEDEPHVVPKVGADASGRLTAKVRLNPAHRDRADPALAQPCVEIDISVKRRVHCLDNAQSGLAGDGLFNESEARRYTRASRRPSPRLPSSRPQVRASRT